VVFSLGCSLGVGSWEAVRGGIGVDGDGVVTAGKRGEVDDLWTCLCQCWHIAP
jgi:hypothetical protein